MEFIYSKCNYYIDVYINGKNIYSIHSPFDDLLFENCISLEDEEILMKIANGFFYNCGINNKCGINSSLENYGQNRILFTTYSHYECILKCEMSEQEAIDLIKLNAIFRTRSN